MRDYRFVIIGGPQERAQHLLGWTNLLGRADEEEGFVILDNGMMELNHTAEQT
jgi:hypothetical protein